ncbi:unnamed protein product [Peniophora sp. CBMAI 1063]|nr:unnamed protein product [Peniophora sp. CBMAI 1063]
MGAMLAGGQLNSFLGALRAKRLLCGFAKLYALQGTRSALRRLSFLLRPRTALDALKVVILSGRSRHTEVVVDLISDMPTELVPPSMVRHLPCWFTRSITMPSLVPLDNTLGALAIGVVISSILYGVNCMQTFLYLTEHCKRDGWFLKSFIMLLWAMETLTCILLNHGIYYYTVTNFGNYDVLLHSGTPWSILVEVGVSAFVALLVQCFFAHRVYILNGRRPILPLFVVVLSLAQFAVGLVYADVSLSFKRFTGGSSDFPYVISLFGLELVADCTIAASTIYYLSFKASRSEITSTRRVIYLAIKYVVSTCLLEVFCIVPIIALWTTIPSALYFSPFISCLARVYSASVMCSLNNRDHLRGITTNAITLSNLNLPTHTGSSRILISAASDISRGDAELSRDALQLGMHALSHDEVPETGGKLSKDSDAKGGLISVKVGPVSGRMQDTFAY